MDFEKLTDIELALEVYRGTQIDYEDKFKSEESKQTITLKNPPEQMDWDTKQPRTLQKSDTVAQLVDEFDAIIGLVDEGPATARGHSPSNTRKQSQINNKKVTIIDQ